MTPEKYMSQIRPFSEDEINISGVIWSSLLWVSDGNYNGLQRALPATVYGEWNPLSLMTMTLYSKNIKFVIH